MAVLPYDAEIEYLESTAAGREWVNTGFIPSSVTDVLTVDAAYTSAGNMFGCLFGVTSRVGGNQRYYQINKTTTSNQFRLITNTGDVFWTKTPEFSGSRHTYVLNKNVLYIDGTQTITGSGTSAESANLYLFARNNAVTASIDTNGAAWRIYSAKLERNGVVQFDLLPVRVGSVGYFYDKVSGTLLPSGGDPLVVGPDKPKLPAGGTMMIANRESFAVASRSRMVEVEYLESTGTQWIDTGIYPGNTTQTDISFMLRGNTASTSYDCVAACEGNSVFYWISARNGSTKDRYLLNTKSDSAPSVVTRTLNVRHNVSFNVVSNKAIVDGVTYSLGSVTNTCSMTLTLWGEHLFSHVSYMSIARIYSVAITDRSTGTVLRDMIPVRVGNVGYMYDRVSGQLFGNGGTGSFVLGPDKATWTNPYVTNGLIAMWDAVWNAGPGAHVANMTEWLPCAGTTKLVRGKMAGTMATGVNYVFTDGTGTSGDMLHASPAIPYSAQGWTIEHVCRIDTLRSGATIGCCFWGGGGLYLSGYLTYWTSKYGSYAFASGLSTARAHGYTIERDANVMRGFWDGARTSIADKTFSDIPAGSATAAIQNSTNRGILRSHCIRLYSRALTAAEIAANYAIDKERFGLP